MNFLSNLKVVLIEIYGDVCLVERVLFVFGLFDLFDFFFLGNYFYKEKEKAYILFSYEMGVFILFVFLFLIGFVFYGFFGKGNFLNYRLFLVIIIFGCELKVYFGGYVL